jgi:lysophospholipase L1-like esterase
MRFAGIRTWRLAASSAAIAALICVGVTVPVASSLAAAGHTAPSSAAAPSGPWYLALGDSVTFGYRESNTVPPPNYEKAASFVGYPEDVGPALGWHVANASCPGETSASLIVEHVQSNGCENSPGGGPGYRTYFPLHVHYTGTQLQYAVQFLRSHPTTRVVSLMIGANDAFLCEETTTDDCKSELPGVLKQISANVADILTVIRHEAGYKGEIIILNYYSLDYANPADNAGSQALNLAMDRGAKPFNVHIANGYAAFKNAAEHSGGDSCTAGLLTQLSSGGCGVHPSVAGQAVLALAVERVIAGA